MVYPFVDANFQCATALFLIVFRCIITYYHYIHKTKRGIPDYELRTLERSSPSWTYDSISLNLLFDIAEALDIPVKELFDFQGRSL